MARIFILDSDPAGLVSHERNEEASDFRAWMFGQSAASAIVVIPEIIDYEVRRSLILAEVSNSVRRLDDLYKAGDVRLLPISPTAMRRAAELWAEARRKHRPTAGDQDIDIDVILSAQAIEFCSNSDDWTIVTENVDHIARYVGAGRARSRRTIICEWLSSPESLI